MKPAELARELGAGILRPGYLLLGGEALLREDALALIREAVLRGAPREFNHDRFDGESVEAGELLDAVRALPVLASRRLVELREPEARPGSAKDLADALAEAMEELRERSETVLVVAAARADRRARWVRAFGDPAARVDCEPPQGARALSGFLRQEAQRLGAALEPAAAEALIEAVGPQLLLLRRELEKAALYAGSGRPITRAHVGETASLAAEEPIWELTDRIGEGRTGDALAVLQRLLQARSAPPVVLASLANHFRKLARTRSGRAPAGHPFAVRKLERQARRYSPARLVACIDAIHRADEVLKGRGALEPRLALERLVIGLSG